jgi:hypothetical protein
MFTARKAAHLVRDERRDKRGGGMVRAESDRPTTTRRAVAELDPR